MKIFFGMILLSLAVLGLVNCSTTGTNNAANSNVHVNSGNSMMNSNMDHSNMNNSNMNMSKTTGSTGGANDFITEAAKGGMAEVELGKLASTKTQNAEVKKFAQKMVQDHSNANTELKSLAAKKNVTLPTDIGAEHKADMDKLSKLSGAEFDKEYVEAMVEDHEKDVKEFQMQADSATDPDVKAFAAKTLPTLKTHLEMIKSIQSKMK
jgi:putative membrane protein